jgi:hypothetical protein
MSGNQMKHLAIAVNGGSPQVSATEIEADAVFSHCANDSTPKTPYTR